MAGTLHPRPRGRGNGGMAWFSERDVEGSTRRHHRPEDHQEATGRFRRQPVPCRQVNERSSGRSSFLRIIVSPVGALDGALRDPIQAPWGG